MSGKRFFSTLDASAAYSTIPMEAESKEYTAFSTPWGLYQFLVMPFGLSSARAVYSRFVQQVLDEGVDRRDVDAYLDDITVATKTEGQHVERLREVLQRHRETGIKLNPSKERGGVFGTQGVPRRYFNGSRLCVLDLRMASPRECD